jgi:acid phosphatase type 7
MFRKSLALVLLTAALIAGVRDNPQGQAAAEIVLRPGTGATVAGAWTVIQDASAAGSAAVRQLDAGAAKLSQALAQPVNYFEQSFSVEAGVRYRLWLRGRAQNNYWGNDSVFVQFTDSLDTAGASKYRIGTTSALEVNLEECSGCGLSGWGWQDTGWGPGVLGPEVVFATAGTQKIRIQTREDGFTIDQMVLSPQQYLTQSPGALKNDTTIVPIDGAAPTVTIVRRPYLQQMSANRVIVVWATRESGVPSVRLTSGSTSRTVNGVSRLVPNSRTGLGYDYYHHEVTIGSLAAATSYAYDAALGSAPIASATFRTAPAKGTGDTTFIVWGDSGTGSTEQRQLATVMANDTFDLALHAGDIAYGNSGGTGDATFKTFNDWFFSVYASWLPSRAFYSSEGNHDSRPSNGDGLAYLDVFTLPTNGASTAYPSHAERFYSFDYGRIHFVVLDTEFAFQDTTRRAEQLSWLESDLAATTQPWKIAVFHRSPYSAGGEHGSDLAVRSAFGPLFEQYGVQLVLSAHEHTYERTLPQAESGFGNEVTYIVTGGGGGPLYPAGTAAWTAYSASRYHYVKTSVTECVLTVKAIGLSGSAFDTTSIERCTAPPAAAEVVLYASQGTRSGRWVLETDGSAAGNQKVRNPNAGAAKRTAALAQPADYLDLTFDATAGIPYRLWLRGSADGNSWANDSVFVQFDNSVNASNSAQFRIGTTSATEVNLEDCSGCGLSGWGWQDNGWGANVRGPLIYFSRTGVQRLRIQPREDGLSIDQVVLSPERYLSASPGALKNDATILIRP